MVRGVARIDIGAIPGLEGLVEEVARTRTPRVIGRGDEDLAILSPAPRPRPRRASRTWLVDTSALAPVPYRTVDQLMASRPAPANRTFTDEEIGAALEEERADAWRRKTS
jgi:hypothetical protein